MADEHFGWSAGEAALIAVLLLRGPQTSAELRTRTERQHAFTSIDEMESTLRGLANGDGALVTLLALAKEVSFLNIRDPQEPVHSPQNSPGRTVRFHSVTGESEFSSI